MYLWGLFSIYAIRAVFCVCLFVFRCLRGAHSHGRIPTATHSGVRSTLHAVQVQLQVPGPTEVSERVTVSGGSGTLL